MAERHTASEPVSRRAFLSSAGTATAAAAGAALPFTADAPDAAAQTPITQTPAGCADLPPSTGYLVVDSKKCAGCATCMVACSMVHEGRASLALSRIQVVQTSMLPYPYDLEVFQCRQCVDPLCVRECPTGAMFVDAAHGHVRRINAAECIGCKTCLQACPGAPHRTATASTIWIDCRFRRAICFRCRCTRTRSRC